MNREKAIRDAYYAALNGHLSYASVNVPIYDAINQNTTDVYVLMMEQTATNNGNFHSQSWVATITFDIVSKQFASVAKDIVDYVCDQMETIIIPTASTTSITQQSGWLINNVRLSDASYQEVPIEAGTPNDIAIIKTITFTQTITKQ